MRNPVSRRAFLSLSGAAAAVTLAGCSFGGRAPFTYDLMPVDPGEALRRRTNRTILITEPTAIGVYDSQRIVVREAGGVLSYLPEAQLSDRLPLLLRTRLVQSFEDRGVNNIARSGDRVNIEIALATDVRAFELDTRLGPVAVVTISARLVDEVARRVIATRAFTAQAQAADLENANVVAALDIAMRNVINQILVWTTSTV